jgi:hypothetical protein
LASEVSARQAAVQGVQTNLDSEVARAQSAEDLKYDKVGGVLSGMMIANAGIKLAPNVNSFLYIGNNWRINASTNGDTLIFEYSADTISWSPAVPFITGN